MLILDLLINMFKFINYYFFFWFSNYLFSLKWRFIFYGFLKNDLFLIYLFGIRYILLKIFLNLIKY